MQLTTPATWENFRDTFLRPGLPANYAILGSPSASILVDRGAAALHLRIPLGKQHSLSSIEPLAAIRVRTILDGAPALEISTGNSLLFQQFYGFALDVLDRVQKHAVDPIAAVADSVSDWRALLETARRLGPEAELGLFGELHVLQGLLAFRPYDALASWTGPHREQHDFRVGEVELEVKATRRLRRIHMISNLAQLVPSPGRRLVLVSLQFESAGAGYGLSLSELVEELRTAAAPIAGGRAHLDRKLGLAGYFDEDAAHYTQRLALRTDARMIPIDDDFPAIRRDSIETLLGAEGAQRIGAVKYELDVEGLGRTFKSADLVGGCGVAP